MKILPFTIPVPHDHTIIVQNEVLPYFYKHLHRHQEVQLTWIVEGEGTLIAGNDIRNFSAGDVFLLGSNQPHVFKSDPEYFEPNSTKQVHAITIFFNPQGKLLALLGLPEMKNIHALLQKLSNGFKIPQSIRQNVSGLITTIHLNDGIGRMLAFVQLLQCFSECSDLEPIVSNNYVRSITDSEGMRIGFIYDYIVQNATHQLTLDDVAGQANMTAHAFCRYFKKHTKYTFINFLSKIRVNEACKMLNDADYKTISNVAFSCGFNSVNNFNRVFKTVTGKTPRMYISNYNNIAR